MSLETARFSLQRNGEADGGGPLAEINSPLWYYRVRIDAIYQRRKIKNYLSFIFK